jgi:DNA-binding Xre family transcriptional regulator
MNENWCNKCESYESECKCSKLKNFAKDIEIWTYNYDQFIVLKENNLAKIFVHNKTFEVHFDTIKSLCTELKREQSDAVKLITGIKGEYYILNLENFV